jgi:hypothetical protein
VRIEERKQVKRTAWGLTAMLVSFLLGTAIALGSLAATGGRLDTAALAAQPFNVPTLLVTCLDPFAILLEIAAIILIVTDSRRFGVLHHRLAWAAAVFFVIWAIANFGAFLPLSFLGMQRGSLTVVKTAQMVKAGAALLQYSIPFLLAFGLTRRAPRVLLWLALTLTAVGNFGVVALPIGGIQLQSVESLGRTMYVPHFDIDYTTGAYPVLLALGYIGGVLYVLVYAFLTWQSWKAVRDSSTQLKPAA